MLMQMKSLCDISAYGNVMTKTKKQTTIATKQKKEKKKQPKKTNKNQQRNKKLHPSEK